MTRRPIRRRQDQELGEQLERERLDHGIVTSEAGRRCSAHRHQSNEQHIDGNVIGRERQHQAREANPRALIQMATGAGKTLTACAFTYRLIKYAGARNVHQDAADLRRSARDGGDLIDVVRSA